MASIRLIVQSYLTSCGEQHPVSEEADLGARVSKKKML